MLRRAVVVCGLLEDLWAGTSRRAAPRDLCVRTRARARDDRDRKRRAGRQIWMRFFFLSSSPLVASRCGAGLRDRGAEGTGGGLMMILLLPVAS
jgi:hypothetical protein